MIVQRILDFILTLERESKLIACDAKLHECLSERFSKRLATEELTRADLDYLLNCYKSRWEDKEIADSDYDYTRDASAVNEPWINLAKELAPLVKKNYLKILIPTLVNDNDLNDFSSLNETVNLFNFYLGHGGKTLYRKLSFCKHLESRQFELSTFRANEKLSVVTVDELARLKLCKQTDREVSVDSEKFKNFWDLMRKKVFVNLQAHGRMPIGLLPHLVELIERYYYLKSNKLQFELFKNDVKNFFQRLYDYELADVNFLYGTKIEYKKDESYLLDLFIALRTANNYSELDNEIKILSQWLFAYNPDLKARCKELESVYEDLAEEIGEESPFIQTDAFVNCCKLLVSLFTTQFELSIFFTRQTHSLWDKKNSVFPEAYEIFTILLPLIALNKPRALESAYEDIIKDIINPARRDNTWYTWFTRHKPTTKWLELAENCKLNELGVYWFEPELLFNALLLFNTKNPSVRMRINHFLDDIIQTYAQNQNDLMKQFRVNILFTEFLHGLSEHHRDNLLRLIKLCDVGIAKSKFLINCTKHINEHISQLCQGTENSSPCFFTQSRKLDKEKLFNLPSEVKDVETMIVEYKTQLSGFFMEQRKTDKIGTYLLKLGQPILSVTQKETAKNSGRPTLDYIGYYT